MSSDDNPIADLNAREKAIAYVMFLAANAGPRTGVNLIDEQVIRMTVEQAAYALEELNCEPLEIQAGIDNASKVLRS